MSEVETIEVESRALTLREQAEALVVKSDADLANAADFLKSCKALEKEISAMMKPVVEAAHQAHKRAKEAENSKLKPVQEAGAIVGRAMSTYQQARDRELAAQRETERKRALAEAQEAQLKRALELEEQGKTAAAEYVLATPVKVETPIIQEPQTVRVAGTALRETWRFQIVNASEVPREYLIPDEQKIGGVVRALKGDTNIPGVRVYSESKVHARAV